MFHSAVAGIAEIEVAHMISKGKFDKPGLTELQQFSEPAAEFCPDVGCPQARRSFITEPDCQIMREVDFQFRQAPSLCQFLSETPAP